MTWSGPRTLNSILRPFRHHQSTAKSLLSASEAAGSVRQWFREG
jgi:hypothetical protein